MKVHTYEAACLVVVRVYSDACKVTVVQRERKRDRKGGMTCKEAEKRRE